MTLLRDLDVSVGRCDENGVVLQLECSVALDQFGFLFVTCLPTLAGTFVLVCVCVCVC